MALKGTFLDTFIEDMPIKEHGVVLRRAGARDSGIHTPGLSTNVPHLVEDHSPDGYEWGYGGSGPADLALNIIENVLRLMGHNGTISASSGANTDGHIFQDSYLLYMDFKREVVARVPDEEAEHTISYDVIAIWIEEKLRQ